MLFYGMPYVWHVVTLEASHSMLKHSTVMFVASNTQHVSRLYKICSNAICYVNF